MWNRCVKISIVIFLLVGYCGYSQNNETIDNSVESKLYNLPEHYFTLDQLQLNKISNRDVANFIFIEQIGNFNQIKSITRSTKSNINLSQRGNFNTIDLNIRANEIDEFVLQRGSHNSFKDYSPHWVKYHGAEIIQYGNDQNIKWFGNNSISEKLKVTMTGRNNTLIIRNFK